MIKDKFSKEIKAKMRQPYLDAEDRLGIAIELLERVYDTQMCMDLWQVIGEFVGKRGDDDELA